jgi:hypothetical protein
VAPRVVCFVLSLGFLEKSLQKGDLSEKSLQKGDLSEKSLQKL